MITNAPNRKARRTVEGRRRAKRMAATAAAATAAAALTVGVSAPAAAPRVVNNANIMLAADPITIDFDLITTGGLFGLVSALGYDTIPFSTSVADQVININLNLDYTKNDPETLYNTINALPMEDGGYGPADIFCSESANPKGCRIAPVVTIGNGAQGLRSAMDSLWSIALGTNLLQYAPLVTGFTATNAIVVNDPYRPNGGLSARFGSALQNLGFAPADKAAVTKVGNHLLDATWEYNPQGDFPSVFNLLALTNSLMGVLPPITSLLNTPPVDLIDDVALTLGVGGPTLAPGNSEATTYLAGILPWFSGSADPEDIPFDSLFATIVTGALPLFEPNAIGTMLVNRALNKVGAQFIFGNPLADVLTPALKILINVAYPDVLTPDALKANPDLITQGYGAYDRTFAQQQIAFGTNTLTRDERQEANKDAWNAFTTALKDQAAEPFFGIIEQVSPASGASVAPVAAAKAAPAAAAAVAAEAPAPAEVAAPVAAPVEKAAPPAVQVDVSDLAADDAPAPEAPVQRTRSRKAASSASDSADDSTGGRSSRHSGSRGGR